MASSLSNLVNNLSGGIHRIKCKYGHDDEKCETFGIKNKYCDCSLEYTNLKHVSIEYKCLCCNKKYQLKFEEKLKERFFNIYKRVCKDFDIKHLGEYHDFFVQIDTLLLADAFENFRNMCLAN